MLKRSQKEIDKNIRYCSGKYEETKRREFEYLANLFRSHFNDVPEMLHLSDNNEYHLELNVETFKLEHWTEILKEKFYIYSKRMINIICSHEISENISTNNGYSDDLVHIFFYIIKQWLIELSNTRFDEQDFDAAIKWQRLIKALIISDFFKSPREDSRLQVLYNLENTMRQELIPILSKNIENKCSLNLIEPTQTHLKIFFSHIFKYLFYVSRDSKYVQNFDYYKFFSIVGVELPEKNITLTAHEKNAWESLKDTLAIKLLYDLIKEDISLLTKTTSNPTYQPITIPRDGFSNDFYHESFNTMMTYFRLPLDYSKNKFPPHIDLQPYVNIHLFLKEIINFMKLFDSAQFCAEIGGGLLVYGDLGDQFIIDLTDCLNCLEIIYQNCLKIEVDCWKALEDKKFCTKDSNLYQASNDWIENYSKSGINCFHQLEKEYHLARNALSQLAGSTFKKSKNQSTEKTGAIADNYRQLHEEHYKHRVILLSRHNILNYQLSSKTSKSLKMFTLNQLDMKTIYKRVKELCHLNATIAQATVYGTAIQSRIKDESNPGIDEHYYASRFFSKVESNKTIELEQLLNLVRKDPTHLKGNYRLAQHFFDEKKLVEAKYYCDMAIRTSQKNGLNSMIEHKLMPLLKSIVALNDSTDQMVESKEL